jgi:hypothetical protein
MKNAKSMFIALLTASLIVAGNAVSHPQSPEQATDQTKTDSSTTKQTEKSAGSAATPKKNSSKNATASAPSAASPAVAPSAPPGGNAPAAKPDAAKQPPSAKNGGMVWVNTDSGVYHKPGTRWYGKTKQGKYMTEADAIKAGYKASARN